MTRKKRKDVIISVCVYDESENFTFIQKKKDQRNGHMSMDQFLTFSFSLSFTHLFLCQLDIFTTDKKEGRKFSGKEIIGSIRCPALTDRPRKKRSIRQKVEKT